MVIEKRTESEEEEEEAQKKLMDELDALRRKVIHLNADLKAFQLAKAIAEKDLNDYKLRIVKLEWEIKFLTASNEAAKQ